MSPGVLQQRQLWGLPTSTSSTDSSCTPFTLPSNGVLSFADDQLVTLTTNVVFQPVCTGGYTYPGQTDTSSVADLRDPFYASTIPQTYVIAVTTVTAWVLVIMLVINPRSFYMSSVAGGGTNFASGRGMIGGATGASNSPGVGSRPWLQKVAAFAVAISLTIATADTFKVARHQYETGYMDATSMRDRVEGSMEVRITRVISDIFLWLAEVQTLIRLFPRHKEKVIIKWIGFALIILDTTFSCLNSFMVDSFNRPRHYVDAIPALSYLFELAVGLLYAAWVIFYGITKRRYAYFHPRMKNICVVALLSHVAILVPVVFFVTDVSEPDVASWGDYFRWVGLAASSVIVWEWVERIELLERDEKKDGILGREIFDGDEMLDLTPTQEMIYTRRPRDEFRPLSHSGHSPDRSAKSGLRLRTFEFKRRRRRNPRQTPPVQDRPPSQAQTQRTSQSITFGALPRPSPSGTPKAPETLATPTHPQNTPPSRTDTTSAASTVYVVTHGASDTPRPARRQQTTETLPEDPVAEAAEADDSRMEKGGVTDSAAQPTTRTYFDWLGPVNPFRRKRMTPPAEVRAAQIKQESGMDRTAYSQAHSRWDIRGRLGSLVAEAGERFAERSKEGSEEIDLPVTVIPAQPRGAAAWSPANLEKNSQDSTTSQASQNRAPATHRGSDGSHETGSSSHASGSQSATWTSSTTAASQPEQTRANRPPTVRSAALPEAQRADVQTQGSAPANPERGLTTDGHGTGPRSVAADEVASTPAGARAYSPPLPVHAAQGSRRTSAVASAATSLPTGSPRTSQPPLIPSIDLGRRVAGDSPDPNTY